MLTVSIQPATGGFSYWCRYLHSLLRCGSERIGAPRILSSWSLWLALATLSTTSFQGYVIWNIWDKSVNCNGLKYSKFRRSTLHPLYRRLLLGKKASSTCNYARYVDFALLLEFWATFILVLEEARHSHQWFVVFYSLCPMQSRPPVD